MENSTPVSATREPFDLRRVLVFCLLAFLISGSAALYIAFNGGLSGMSGLQTLLVLTLWYMPGPAYAHLLTRLITREGWSNLWLHPRIRRGWRAWLVAWLAPGILTLAGAALYFLVFPQHFDSSMGQVRAMLDQSAATTGQALPFSVEMLILIQTLTALFLAPVLNALPSLGEEFGWRAYLQPKLMALGWRRAMLWMGLIWGVWHWPLIAMGHNYGLEYPGAPWLGMVVFLLFTTTVGTLFGWLTIRGGSVWPAVIGHSALNGIAALPLLFVQGTHNPLLGPAMVGALAGVPLLLVTIWLWLNPPTER
jgi:uncharacterized protein